MRIFKSKKVKRFVSLFLSVAFILGMLGNCAVENNGNGSGNPETAPESEHSEENLPDTSETP